MHTWRSGWLWFAVVLAGVRVGSGQEPYIDWAMRQPLTLSGYTAPGALTNFPVLVVLGEHLAGFQYANFASLTGGDLRFADADETTPLAFEIEKWDSAGLSYVWVQVPEIAGTQTVIHAYWGNDEQTTPPAANPWDAHYIGVWHLAQTNALDSTTNAFHGTAIGNVALSETGVVDGAVDTTTGNHIQVPDHDAFTVGSQYTVSTWLRSDPVANYEGFFGTYNGSGFIFSLDNTVNNYLGFWAANVWRWSTYSVPDNVWKHVAYTANGTDGRLYVDGVQVMAASGVAINNGSALQLGAGGTSWSGYRFDGLLDEARLSKTARGSNWVWACFQNQASNDAFIVYGDALPQSTELAVKTLAISALTPTSAVFHAKLGQVGEAENPAVYFCWGPADGGTNGTQQWARADYAGSDWGRGEAFSRLQDGLLTGSTYVYRAYATNSTGAAWSPEAVTFRTVCLPTLAGPDVEAGWTTALISGEVTDTGEETPTVVAEYWETAGGPTNRVALGLQTGAFSTVLRFLTPDTGWTCRLGAWNSAGDVWTAPAAFDTRAPYYVSPAGGNTPPYGSWADAATNLYDALALALTNAGSAVVFGDGVYVMDAPIALTNAVSLIGHNGATAATLVPRTSPSTVSPLWVNHAEAVLDGLSLTGCVGRLTYNVYGPLNLANGTVRRCILARNVNVSSGGGLVSGGWMEDCTIVSNSSTHVNTGYGGGLRITGGVVTNCVIAYNTGVDGGGGVYMTGGTLVRSVLAHNTKGNGNANRHGGGLWMTAGTAANLLIYSNRIVSMTGYGAGAAVEGSATMWNCTIADNLRTTGNPYSGLYQTGGSVINTIAYYNGTLYPAGGQENVATLGGTLTYSCTQPSVAGEGNTSGNPTFADRSSFDYRLLYGSAALDAGTAVPLAEDLDGAPRPVNGDGFGGAEYDMGCYESAEPGDVFACTFTGAPLVGTNSLTVAFTAAVIGPGTESVRYIWDFDGDGTADADGMGLSAVTNTYAAPGFYTVKLRCVNAADDEATLVRENYVQVYSLVAYVSSNGTPTKPYDTWEKAAAGLQEAIDAVAEGGTVFVSGGVYAVNAKIDVFKAVTVTGVDGPAGVTLKSPGANRLMDINHPDAVVEKLTFTGVNLGSHPNSGAVVLYNGLLRHCAITNNALGTYGGGLSMSGGLAHDLFLWRNGALHQNTGYGGGAYLTGGTLSNSVIVENRAWDSGGGVGVAGNNARVTQCVISNNYMYGFNLTGRGGGGVWMSAGQIDNSLIAKNFLAHTNHLNGGGLYLAGGRLVNCTVAGNYRAGGNPNSGLYMTAGAVTNCIFFLNSSNYPATGTENVYQTGGAIHYSCVSPLEAVIAGSNNTGDNPLFAGAATNNFRLAAGSPCIDTGFEMPFLTADLDGLPRPVDGNGDKLPAWDMGAYERPPLPPHGTVILIR